MATILANITPSAESLAFRAELGKQVSSLRRVRPKVPFFKLPAHRIPTLRLYRDLLRNSPTENVRSVFEVLLMAYKYRDAFKRARSGDIKTRALLDRYDKLIGVKADKEYMKTKEREELAWIHKMRNRPILTGALMLPNQYHGPLPRMKRQPLKLTRMIGARMKAKYQRFLKQEKLIELKDMINREASFEDTLPLEKNEKIFGGDSRADWQRPINASIYHMNELFARYDARAKTPIPLELLETLKQARRNKIENLTRERERERKGAVLRSTILRKRRGVPAHVMARMTPQEKREDLVMRGSVSEVGYVGVLKERHGWKIHKGLVRGPRHQRELKLREKAGWSWDVELGQWVRDMDARKLEKELECLRKANEAKRKEAEAEEEV